MTAPAPTGNAPLPAYATVADFCKLSGIGRTSLYDALKGGHIPARKLGSRTLIDVAGGLAWLDALPAYAPGNIAARR